MVGLLVDGVFLSAKAYTSQIHAAGVVVRLQSRKARITVFRVRRRENQGIFLDHF